MGAAAQIFTSLAAAVIGGIIAPQLLQSRERRIARSAIIEKIREIEDGRWGPPEDYPKLVRLISAFEVSAIVAGVPRQLVQIYVNAATEAMRHTYPVSYDLPDLGRAVDSQYNQRVVKALEASSNLSGIPG